MIKPPPDDINECGILRLLREKSTERDGIAEKVQRFIEVATPMLDFVASGPFRTYTLHNRDHAKKLLHLLDHIIPSSTLQNLSPLECLIVVYAAFLHDMGMALTSTERNRILESSDFQDSIREWPEIWNSLTQARKRLSTIDESERLGTECFIFQLSEAALCAYLRPRHATASRYRELFDHLKHKIPDLFCYREISFEDWMIEICVSHNLDAAILHERKDSTREYRFPRDLVIAQQSVNTQFCAALLRIADILDFDRERTPRILFESLGIPYGELPGGDISLCEWEKHMAIHSLNIQRDELLVFAECHHPSIEKSIREFCILIEREIRDTMAILKNNPPDVLDKYKMELPLNVIPRINSIGYTYKDLSLRLNQSAIISLLMGERLYSHSGVALRELIQNALDACEVRRRLQPVGSYSPAIEVTSDVDSIGRRWIEVNDNGIGMDEHVLSEYFLRLGDSYCESPEFKRHFAKLRITNEPFRPISRFGIGILSVFLIADILEVKTSSLFSPRDDRKGRLVRIEKLGGLAFFADSSRNSPGTTVKIRLKPEISSVYEKFANETASYLRWLIVRPWFLVRIALGLDHLTFNLPMVGGAYYSISQEGREYLLQQGYETVVVELERWSDRLSGVVVLLFAIDSNGLLSLVKENRRIAFLNGEPRLIDPAILVQDYKGNRLTINGFHVRTFRTKNLLRFRGGTRFAFLSDVDASGGDEIEFDVSRERLTKKGQQSIRREITSAVLNALSETNVLARMAPEVRLSIPSISLDVAELQRRLMNREHRPDALGELFDAVTRQIPDGKWPHGLHQQIAEKLGISSKLVSNVIGRLLASGIISKSIR